MRMLAKMLAMKRLAKIQVPRNHSSMLGMKQNLMLDMNHMKQGMMKKQLGMMNRQLVRGKHKRLVGMQVVS